MVFTSPTLSYEAVEYANNCNEPQWVPKKLTLTKQKNSEEYGAGDHQILVRVHAASLNPVDSMLYNTYNRVVGYLKGRLGMGIDYSGTIVSIGASAAKKTDLTVGDEVCGMYMHPFFAGTVAEYLLIDPRKDPAITRKPRSIDLTTASAWPLVYGTAHQMIEATRVKKGDKVLVLGGATAVGRMAIQIMAQYYNTRKIVATCSGNSAPLVKKLGADDIIDYTSYTSLKEPVEREAATAKFDVILDCVGNSDLFGTMDKILVRNGHYITICGEKKFKYQSVSFFSEAYSQAIAVARTVLCSVGYNKYHYQFLLASAGSWIHDGAHRLDNGMEVAIDSTYSKTDFSKAFARLRSNKASGKIVVKCTE